MARSASLACTGAKPKPQLPIVTEVTPCQLPFLMPMSARYRGSRVPSIIMPFLMIVSNSAIKPPFLLLVLVIGHAGFDRPVLQDPDEVRTLLAVPPLRRGKLGTTAG